MRHPYAAINFHRPGVATLHLWKKLRRIFLLNQNAAHAAATEINGKGQSDGAGADDDDFGVHQNLFSIMRGLDARIHDERQRSWSLAKSP